MPLRNTDVLRGTAFEMEFVPIVLLNPWPPVDASTSEVHLGAVENESNG